MPPDQTNIWTGQGHAELGRPTRTSFDVCADYHTYAFEWTPDYIAWFIDGTQVRRVTGASVTEYTQNASQGMAIHFNIWARGLRASAETWQSFDAARAPVHQLGAVLVVRQRRRSRCNGARSSTVRRRQAVGRSGTGLSPFNLSTHNPANVSFVNGIAVLSHDRRQCDRLHQEHLPRIRRAAAGRQEPAAGEGAGGAGGSGTGGAATGSADAAARAGRRVAAAAAERQAAPRQPESPGRGGNGAGGTGGNGAGGTSTGGRWERRGRRRGGHCRKRRGRHGGRNCRQRRGRRREAPERRGPAERQRRAAAARRGPAEPRETQARAERRASTGSGDGCSCHAGGDRPAPGPEASSWSCCSPPARSGAGARRSCGGRLASRCRAAGAVRD